MDNQLVTITGRYQDGLIEPLSTFLPKGKYKILITFLESLDEEPIQKNNDTVTVTMTSQEKINLLINQIGISPRELEILELIQKGYTNQRISQEIELSDGTVRNYISSLLDKLKATNRTQLVNLAISKGILKSQ